MFQRDAVVSNGYLRGGNQWSEVSGANDFHFSLNSFAQFKHVVSELLGLRSNPQFRGNHDYINLT
jgi:hypothetical protein